MLLHPLYLFSLIFYYFFQAATKNLAETYARRTALSMTSAIVKVVTGLLIQARDGLEDEKGFNHKKV